MSINSLNRMLSNFANLLLKIRKYKHAGLDLSSWDISVNKNDHLLFGGHDCSSLAKKYGTPLYVVNEDVLIENYEQFCKSFRDYDPNIEIFYSYKTNPVPGVLKILHNTGAGAEVISPYELWLALKQDVSPEKIIYNGPYKSVDSLKTAIEQNIRLINIDSFDEIEKIDKLANQINKKPRVGIRVFSEGGWTNQFGFNIDNRDALEAYSKCVKKKNLKVCGIHTHIGSSLKKTKNYTVAIRSMVELVGEVKKSWGIDIDHFDVGGGFGVPTVKNFPIFESILNKLELCPPSPPKFQECPTTDDFAKQIVQTFTEMCTYFNVKKPKLILEPGRIITSTAQILLLTIQSIKQNKKLKKVVIADGGINIGYPATWEYHEIMLANRMSEKNEDAYVLAGPICTPNDRLYRFKVLPRLKVGDVLAIMDAGAYFVSFSNTFSFPRPAIVSVSGGNDVELRRKELFKDMIIRDHF